jgi:hypothetical protein
MLQKKSATNGSRSRKAGNVFLTAARLLEEFVVQKSILS